jgi:hypothetical protein
MSAVSCYYCDQPILPTDEIAPGMLMVDGYVTQTHRECALRAVIGGIGHLENHQYWCNTMHDPDGGYSYRESALRVDEWISLRAREPYSNPEDE